MTSPPPPNPTGRSSPPPSATPPQPASTSPSTGPERQTRRQFTATATNPAHPSESGGWTAPTPNLIYDIQTGIDISSDPFARVASVAWDPEEQYADPTPSEGEAKDDGDEDDDGEWEDMHDDSEDELEEEQECLSDIQEEEEDDDDNAEWEEMRDNTEDVVEEEQECHAVCEKVIPLIDRIRELEVEEEEDEYNDVNVFSGNLTWDPADAEHEMFDDEEDIPSGAILVSSFACML
ncbi:hypothetical protein HDU89_006209 [Geranomyces variabilis]|nr:hypothetical protein HDU89_006209 [Geranomyces variabilis]